MLSPATATAAQVTVPRAAHSAPSLAISAGGSSPLRLSPNSSRNWLAKMTTPIPAVKASVTG